MGSGGGSYFPRSETDLGGIVQRAKQQADKERLDSDVNALLRDVLASCERDPDATKERLERVQDVLKERAELQNIVFGGSVAKHTYVDGLSDVDALIVLNQQDFKDRSPQSILNEFAKLLGEALPAGQVQSVEKGRLAVTITYRDGSELQLLPALRTKTTTSIPASNGKGWNETRPKAFQKLLSKENQKVNGVLVPCIKLAKSILYGLPKQKRLDGYHVEALAIDAVKSYRGPRTPKEVLIKIFEAGASRVMSPMSDVTGQSRVVDDYLGPRGSTERRLARDTLAGVARRLESAASIDQWKKELGL